MEEHLIVKILLTLGYSLTWILLVKKKGHTIWESFKGEDHILQISEFVVLMGIIGYVFMIPADALWGIVASPSLFVGINSIIMTALGVTGAVKFKEAKNGQENK